MNDVDVVARAAPPRRSQRSTSIALACHVNPDGDALGSMLGLFHVLRAAGHDVVASFSEPFAVAPHYRELPGLDLLTPPGDFPAEPDVMVTFDCGSLGRLGDLETAAKAAARADRARPPRVEHALRHHQRHRSRRPPRAACSCAGSSRRSGSRSPPTPRSALYAALVCDTGRFQYETTTPERVRARRELVAFDVPVSRLSRQLFEEHRFAYLKLLGEALANAELDVERRFVWTAVTQDMLARHGVTLEEVEGLIDIVRRTTEAEVTCVLKEEADGTVRVSLRSLGRRRRVPHRRRQRRRRPPVRGRLRVDDSTSRASSRRIRGAL